jgi:hypothetical protein
VVEERREEKRKYRLTGENEYRVIAWRGRGVFLRR